VIAASPAPVCAGKQPIDFSRRFIPEFITPLAYTAVYRELTDAQRLRYNQFYASNFHEQFMSLEKVLIEHLLQPLTHRFCDEKLAEHLVAFRNEEIKHTAMFHDLHVRCEPRLYADHDFYFLRMPKPLRWALHQVGKGAAMFPFCLWLTIIEEERRIFYSKMYLDKATELEPTFVATHRIHLADDVGHVRRDKELLERLWPNRSNLWRNANARIFSAIARVFQRAQTRRLVGCPRTFTRVSRAQASPPADAPGASRLGMQPTVPANPVYARNGSSHFRAL
jgi:P-aminobenzoate N-oxygenase AurF